MNKISLLFGLLLTMSLSVFAQKDVVPAPKGWHLLDKEKDGYYGISLDKAYDFVNAKKIKSKTVVVAVIDSGIDTLHEDLKPNIWINEKEIPGNKIDDDKNGYIDDVYGWNFIGGKDGSNVKEDSYEAARVFHKFKSKYDGKDVDEEALKAADKNEYKEYTEWKRAKLKVMGNPDEDGGGADIAVLNKVKQNLAKSDSVLKIALAKETYTGEELESYLGKTDEEKKAKASLFGLMKANNSLDQSNVEFLKGLSDYIDGEIRKEEAKNNPPKEYRKEVVQDDETNFNDRFYGNGDVMASTPFHGTHCAGIIGADRSTEVGIKGVANNVKLMMIRAVPDGDEHDKDIALAIRYAVDNGAQIISMSFGKGFSPEKYWVDDAVKYAESKNVLLVHAAGNDNKDIDVEPNFPCAGFEDGKGRAKTWITVGASGDPTNGGIKANFSNYGKKEIDVFAPGVQIYSTIPGGNTYGNASGTSMACPVVAGTAAFLLSHYPTLSAKQLKQIIEKSAVAPDVEATIEGKEGTVKLSELSITGGIVNAYEAVKLASVTKGERIVKITKPVKAVKKAPIKKAKK